MGTNIEAQFKIVFERLKRDAFLLESDPKLPSVCNLITGGPLQGSWWSHPMAQIIFAVNERLEDHPDMLVTKLVSGKVTFVHRELWAEVVAVGTARDAWQMNTLSSLAAWLLAKIDEADSLATDGLKPPGSGKAKVGDASRQLERKLLISAAQIHTASGAHAKVLETWAQWAARVQFNAQPIPADEARKTLEARMTKLNRDFKGAGKLPWQ